MLCMYNPHYSSCIAQDQLREIQDFQRQVDNYGPQMDNLSSLATVADPFNETASKTKMKALQNRYDQLKALPKERQGILDEFLPIVQQYESSRGAWQDLLCGWEEKVELLPPPKATPAAIQVQIDDIKVFKTTHNAISNRSPWMMHTLCCFK